MLSDMGRKAVGLIAAVLFVSVCSMRAATYSGVVEGVVKNSSGQPVAGAFVKLKNEQRRLTFMVISQAQGRYTADRLPAGKYIVQGVGNGFQSGWSAPVDVAEGRAAKLDISLTAPQAAMLPPAWPGRIPEEEAARAQWPEGAGKQIATSRCVACHEAGRTLARRQSREGWQESVHDMRENMRNMGMPDLTDQEASVLLDYLASNFPPMARPDPNSRLPRTPMRGEAMRYRVVQYDLENGNAETHDIAVAPDGTGWANQRAGGKLSKFDPETYEYSEFTPPAIKAPQARMGNLQVSKDGVVWLPENNDRRWLSFDIKTAKWTSYEVPTWIRGSAGGNSMALAEDGLIWNTGPGLAKSLNPVTKEWKAYISPTGQTSKTNPGGYGIAIAGDGKVWFAMNHVDKIARVDPATGKVDEFNIPVQGIAYPRRMTNDTEGNIWVSLWSAGKLMKIDYKTAEMSTFDPPTTNSGVYSVDVDEKNNLIWMTLHRVDKIARFNPKTLEWVEFPLPQAETDVRRVEIDPSNPNRLWWSTVGNFGGVARMGFVELLN